MQIELETLPNCITAMRVELPPERVAQERKTILRDYQGSARLPGYRPGKAPANIVENRYKKEIQEELQRKLVSAGTREAISEKKLRVLSVSDVEQVEITQDDKLRFTARLITAPEFELPPYQGLPIKVPPTDITDTEIDASIERLRGRMADFNDIEGRGLQMDDFCVIDFAGRHEGQPVSESLPMAPKELAGKENFWIKLTPQTLIPGFSEALIGAAADETRDFSLEIPADFPVPDLAGKKIDYTVKVRELKSQTLPELNDEFAAKLLPGKTLAEVREQVKIQLQNERGGMIEELKRRQIVTQLLAATEFDLPQEYVRSETKRIMDDIVRQNQERGVTDDEIRDNTQDIVDNAGTAAKDRLKSAFILTRIAEKESLKVTKEEFDQRLNLLSARSQMTREKLLRNLQERDAFGQIEEEILLAKTLAFLASSATIETVSAAEAMPPEEDEEQPV